MVKLYHLSGMVWLCQRRGLICKVVVIITLFLAIFKPSYHSSDSRTLNGLIDETTWYITKDGIYPLRQVVVEYNNWTKISVIPKKFFRNIPNKSRHYYEWILNPFKKCVPSVTTLRIERFPDVFLLVAIASASWEFERRELIRKTWATVQRPLNKSITYVFFLGNDQRVSKERLQNEFNRYQDIVLESFDETYKNLTLKTQGQLKWATHFCPNARYVMHVDDDVFVDIKGIVQHLVSLTEKRHLLCSKIFMPVVRRDGKWAMSNKEYGKNQYPRSCVGWCYVMTQKVANELYVTSLTTSLIHLEDVTFTGILREKIKNLTLQKLPKGEELCQHLGWPKDKPTNEKLKNAWWKLKSETKIL